MNSQSISNVRVLDAWLVLFFFRICRCISRVGRSYIMSAWSATPRAAKTPTPWNFRLVLNYIIKHGVRDGS